MEPLSFRQISDFHEFAKKQNPAQFGSMNASDFAKFMAETDTSRDYSQGFNANFVKHGSVAVDRAIESTGIPSVTEYLGRKVGETVGMGELGADLGKGLPRGLGQVAAVGGGLALGGPLGWGTLAAGTLSAGAEGYTATDSPLAGVVSGALTAATPGIARVGELGARRLVATNAANVIKSPFARAVTEEIGAETALFAADAVGQTIQGQNPFSKENIFANLASNVAALPVTAPMFAQRLRTNPNTKLSPYQHEVIQADLAKLAQDQSAIRAAEAELQENLNFNPNLPALGASDTMLAQMSNSADYRKLVANSRLGPDGTLNLAALDTEWVLKNDPQYQALKQSYTSGGAENVASYGRMKDDLQAQSRNNSSNDEARWLEYWTERTPKSEGVVTGSKVPILEGPTLPKSIEETVQYIDVQDGNLRSALVNLFSNLEANRQLKPKETTNLDTKKLFDPSVEEGLAKGFEADQAEMLRANAEYENAYAQLQPAIEQLNADVQTKVVKTVDDAFDLPKVINASTEILNKWFKTTGRFQSVKVPEQLGSIFDHVEGKNVITAQSIERTLGKHLQAEGSFEGAVQRVVQQMKNEYNTKLNDYLKVVKETKTPKPLKASDFVDAEQKAITDAYTLVSSKGDFAMRALDRVLESYNEAKTGGQSPDPSMIVKNLRKLLGSEKIAEAKTKKRKGEVSTETPLGDNLTVGDTVAQRPTETEGQVSNKAVSIQGSLDEIVKAPDFEKRVARVTELRRKSDVDKAVNQMRAVYELIQEGVIQPNKLKSSMDEAQIARFSEKLRASGFDSDVRSAGPLIKRSLDRLRSVLEDAGVRGFGESTGAAAKNFDEIINEVNARRTPQAQLAADVNVFFNRFLDELGMEPALKEQYLATAQRVAQAYGNLHETRLVELQQKIGRDGLTGEVLQTMGLFVPMGPRYANTTTTTRNLVALVGNRMVSKQLEPFLKISALGHELFHALANNLKISGIDSKRVETLERMNAFANDLTEIERKAVARSLVDIMIPRKLFEKDAAVLNPMIDYVSKSGEEFTAFYAQMLSVGLASRTKPERRGFLQRLKQFFTFSSQFEADFGQGMYRNLSEMTDMLKAGLDAKEVKPESVGRIVEFQKDLQSLMQTPAEMQRAADFMQALNASYDPKVSLEKITAPELRDAQALKLGTDAKKFFDERFADPARVYSKGRKLGQVQARVGNPFQAALEVASFIPAARDFIATVYDTQSKVNLFRQTQMLDFMVRDVAGQWTTIQATGGKKLTPEQTRTFNAVDLVETSPSANKAFSDIARFSNEEGQQGRGKLHTQQELVQKVPSFAKLSTQQQSDVFHLIELTRKANQTSANLMIDNTNYVLSQNVGRIVQYKNANIEWSKASQLGQLIRAASQDAHAQGLAGPNAEAFVTQRLAAESQGVDVIAAVKQAVRQSPIVTEIATHLSARPWYFNEQRVGDYLITYQTKDGQKGTIGAQDKKDVRSKMAQLMKDGYSSDTFQVIKKSDNRDNSRVQLTEDTLQLFQKLEQAAFDEALKNLGSDAAESLRANYNPGDVSLIALQKQQAKDYEKPRALAPGREYLNIWETSVNYYNRLSHSLANQRMKAATELMLNDPKFKENPDIQKQFSEYRDSVLAPVARSPHVENAVFTYFLGFNLSSAMMNLSQNVMILPTQLISQGANVVEAHNLVKNASIELAKAYRVKGLSRGEVRFEDAELNKHFQQAVAEGFLRNGAFTDLLNNEELLAVNTKRLRDGKKGLTQGELLGNASHLFFKASKFLFSGTESANAQIGFISGWNLGKQRGLSGDQLYAFAKEQSRAANFSGGKYNRPFGFYKLGNLQGVGSAVLALQNFTIANISMMSRLFKDSVGATGLSAAEKTQARKAFATMLTAQFIGGGLLGLPLVGAGLQIVEDLFETEAVAPAYEAIATLGGDDQELGNTIADMAMNGMANQMLGVDVGSRLGMGSLGPFNAYNGFELKGILGATGGLVKNIYDGVKQINQDGLTLTNPIIPPAVRKPLELYANKGNFYDRAGNLMMEPSQAEQVAYFFGFNPKELSDLKLRDRLLRQADIVAKSNRRKEYEDFAQILLEGEPSSVRLALQQRQQQDSTFDIESAYRSIVDIAVQRMLPSDSIDRGSNASAQRRGEVSKLFSPRQPRALESAKAQLENALMSALSGRPTLDSNREFVRNQLLDQILQTNPNMPRSLAMTLVDRRLGQIPRQ